MVEILPHETRSTDGKLFLLVEDSLDDAFLIEIEFRRSELARLCIVREGQAAIDYLQGKFPYDDRKEYPLPNVILLDLKMPGKDGFDVLRWIRRQPLDQVGLTPISVLSASVAVEDVKLAYQLGANLFMTKPADGEELRERIRLLTKFWCANVCTMNTVAAGMRGMAFA